MTTHNLPPQVTPFIGRLKELAEIAQLVADPACRLVSLLGPGGIGKTRLALQAAGEQFANFAEGVYFVALAPVNSPDLLASAIAGTLKLSLYGLEEPSIQIVNYLREKRVLLLLDNFEHLLDGTPLVSDILSAAPDVKIIVTSRERLNLQEEWVVSIQGLLFPQDQPTDPVERYAAVQMFAQRARQIQGDFSLVENARNVVAICQRVEGMPLAIELAATWLRVMPCHQIATQIQHNLDFLTTPVRNVPERHRSLRTVFEQSWSLLSKTEREVLASLSIFRGGFDQEAAETVSNAALPLLAGLVDKSLIRLNPSGRYDLHELLRQFAADKLAEMGATAAATARHLAYFSKLTDEAEAHLYSPDQEAWFDRLEMEHDNLGAALAWTLRDENAEAGLRLAGALGFFWELRSYYHEAGDWLGKLLTMGSDAPAAARSKALRVAGAMAAALGDYDQAEACCEESLLLARGTPGDSLNVAWALANLGWNVVKWDDNSRALLEEALAQFRELGDDFGLSHVLRRTAMVFAFEGDYDKAIEPVTEALVLDRNAHNKNATAWSLTVLGLALWGQRHDPKQTLPLFEESLHLAREIRDQFHIASALFMLGDIMQALGDYGRARAYYAESLTIFRDMGTNNVNRAAGLIGIGELAGIQGLPERAATLFGAAMTFVKDIANIPMDKVADFERDIAAVRAQLGEAAFMEAWAAGQAMTTQQAIAYALQDSAPANTSQLTSRINQTQIEPLTRREHEVLRLVANGLSNAEIAQKLFLSVATIKVHTRNIYGKLGVNTRMQAITQAQKFGLL